MKTEQEKRREAADYAKRVADGFDALREDDEPQSMRIVRNEVDSRHFIYDTSVDDE